MDLSCFPRICLGHFPTPLEPMAKLTALLGGPRLWIKRDDCTGLASGGNKTRKLEFLMAEAVAAHADIVITQGATQSNHARQTAAAAAKLGMKCLILLEDRTGSTDPNYVDNGNVMLNRLHGATVERRAGGTNMQQEMEIAADRLRSEGARPYVIPGGGSNPVGALGYVNAAFELIEQAASRGLKIDYLVHATGSAGTQAGHGQHHDQVRHAQTGSPSQGGPIGSACHATNKIGGEHGRDDHCRIARVGKVVHGPTQDLALSNAGIEGCARDQIGHGENFQ